MTIPPLGLVLAVCVSTFLVSSGTGPSADALAATPDRVAQGRLWLLVTSALYTGHPLAISLLSFVVLAAVTLATCGPRVFWIGAAAGHLGSTALVYFFIALSRAVVPGAFESSLSSPDYGVSAVSSAWLAAVATVAWRARERTARGRFAIVLCCATVGLFAYTIRPNPTVISSEHLVAFALGVLVASGGIGRPRIAIRRRVRLDPVTVLAVAVAVLLVAGSTVPDALGDLASRVKYHRHASAASCVVGWNRQATARCAQHAPPG